MANPLILTLEEFTERQTEFADYPKALSMGCVSTVNPAAFTQRIRKIILDELGKVARDGQSQGGDSLPQAPVWGPTVMAPDAATIYFKLVPQGTEDQHQSTDWMADSSPPPLPANKGDLIHPSEATEQATLSARFHANHAALHKYKCSEPDLRKLYRASDLVEVTTDEINAEMLGKI